MTSIGIYLWVIIWRGGIKPYLFGSIKDTFQSDIMIHGSKEKKLLMGALYNWNHYPFGSIIVHNDKHTLYREEVNQAMVYCLSENGLSQATLNNDDQNKG